MRLDLLLGLDINDLKCGIGLKKTVNGMVSHKLGHTLERENSFRRMHDCRICIDLQPKDIGRVGEVDYNDLVLFVNPFPLANETVGL